MSKSIFSISSNSHRYKPLQKFEVPPSNQDNYFITSSHSCKNIQKTISSQEVQTIFMKINQVDQQNKKLLNISNRMLDSSIMCDDSEKLYPIIYTIEQQMKKAFNQLIQSIQEFYIDIDNKVKQIGMYLATYSNTDTHQTSKNGQDQILNSLNLQQFEKKFDKANQNEHLKIISQKIQILQKDLQETKLNQKKLITIIQKMIEKYQLTHETTIIKQDPFLKKKLNYIIEQLQKDDHKKTVQNISVHQTNRHKDYYHRNQYNNTFAYVSSPPHNIQKVGLQKQNSQRNSHNFLKNSLQSSISYEKIQKYPHKVVPSARMQNPNDYSLYHELKKIEQPQIKDYANDQKTYIRSKQQKSFHTNQQKKYQNQQKKYVYKQKVQDNAYSSSTISVNSYAPSNATFQSEDQCFIKKLYSKQSHSLNKVSLKGANNYFQFKKKQQIIDSTDKNHRQAYLIKNLNK